MKSPKSLTILSCLLLVLCNCSTKKTIARSEVEMLKTQLRGKDWQVVAMIIDNERIEGGTVADAAPYINFSDRVIDLVAYCNAYKGTYLLEKDHFFKVTFQSGIRIECEGDIALYEKILINILKNANKIILDNHQLSIFQTDQTFLFLAPK